MDDDRTEATEDTEDDHDLLTFAASDERLRAEIADIEAALPTADASSRAAAEARLTDLRAALERNTKRAATSPGETGFLNYTPPGH